MRKIKLTSLHAFAVLLALFSLIASCRKDPPENNSHNPGKAPRIIFFTPDQGPEGAAVEISGENFSDDKAKLAVYFNGKTAEIVSSTTTSITAKVPDEATTGKITVSINGKTATSNADFVVNATAPSITSVAPEIGEAGTAIEITGTNFSAEAKVYIGDLELFNVAIASKTKITATLPQGVLTAKIKVVQAALQAESPQLVYIKPTITAIAPVVAPKEAFITLTGKNFVEGETTVKFGDVTVDKNDILFVSATELKLKVPLGLTASSAKIFVSIKGQETESVQSFTLLNISSFTPTAKGGETIHLTGSGFSTTPGENIVKINNVTATVTAATSTSLSVTVPMGTSTGYITVSRGGQTTSTTSFFTYEFTLMVTTFAGGDVLRNPSGVAIDKWGNMYVADQYNHTIRKISASGAITTFAGTGVAGHVNGNATVARFNYPTGLATDNDGNLYVADLGNHVIRKISPTGQVITLAGEAEVAGSSDGIGSAAHFHSPAGVVVDQANNVYVTDARNQLIRKILPNGEVITIAGKAGIIGLVNGTGSAARFNYPAGIVVDGTGTLYVADEGNHQIRKITAGGVVTTYAGTGAIGLKNGNRTDALFNFPNGLAMHMGTLYVTDAGNQLIRAISASGSVTTLAGTAGVPGSANGLPEAAYFNNPSGIIVNANGQIFVVDRSNHAVRMLSMQ